MTGIKLRDYQRECIDAVFQSWYDGLRRPAVVLPTGAGKTVVFSHLIREFQCPDVPRLRGTRVMVLVHRDELADQAIAKIRATLPDDVTIGKVKAQNDDTHTDVMVCSVQTLANESRRRRIVTDQERCGNIGLIITDECHHAAAPSYKKIYDAFPDALQLGVTATLARGDGVGLGSVWEDVVYRRSILNLISKGHLCDVKAQRVELDGLDLDAVKRSRGDYQAGALGAALEESGADELVARAYKTYAADRPGIVFTPTVATAATTAESLNRSGITAAVVSGETPREERALIYGRFRTGEVQVLANCMVLTEGFDAPWASCAVIARPTQSAPLYTQMVGRVLRTWPGKRDALVLDVVGASGGNKLRTLIDLEPGAVRAMREAETLAEAVVREAEEEAARTRTRVSGVALDLKLSDVDLFSSSDTTWLMTPAGVMFVSCGEKTVFLWPSKTEGLWTVCTTKGKWGRKWEATQYRDLDLGSAMAWGEAVADDYQEFSVSKRAGWRRTKPSEGQVAYAERLGIDTTGLKKGQLSDAISMAVAGEMFDPHARSGLRV